MRGCGSAAGGSSGDEAEGAPLPAGSLAALLKAPGPEWDARIRFIHIEIYRDNDPSKGFNCFVGEWRLPTEPWVFLVGSDGRIEAKFEGSLSAAELFRAVRSLR